MSIHMSIVYVSLHTCRYIHCALCTHCSESDLCVLSLNCCSIRSQAKQGLLHAIIYEHRADIIIGCESHLNSTYLSSGIFPPLFNAFKKDHSKGSGGVFIAYSGTIPILEEPLFNEDAEMIWAKLCIRNSKPIHICSFYRPQNNLTDPITNLRRSLGKFFNSKSKHHHCWRL